MGQPVNYEIIPSLINQLRSAGKKVVLVGGYFDILHTGHARFLQLCAKYGDCLIVYLHNDQTTNLIKGPSRPIIPAFERASLVAALRMVNYATVIPHVIDITQAYELDMEIVESLKPDVYICVENDSSVLRLAKLQKSQPNTQIVTVPSQSLVWSTSIIENSMLELQSQSIHSLTEPDDYTIVTKKDASTKYKNMMELAFKISDLSPCKILKVGAVIANGEKVLGQGFNRPPGRIGPCWCETNSLPKVSSGPGHPPCFALHAESVAILEAIKTCQDLSNTTLYSTHCPCMACSKALIETGVTRIVYCSEYTDTLGRNMFIKSNIEVVKLTKYLNVES